MDEYNLVYRGQKFDNPYLKPIAYCDEYFKIEIDMESDLFYELRKHNNIIPNRLCDSSKDELEEIKIFFNQVKDSFLFLFADDGSIIGSILFMRNYIQSLCISKNHQRKGYGSSLVKIATNKILESGYSEITLNVLKGNTEALELYRKLGFIIV